MVTGNYPSTPSPPNGVTEGDSEQAEKDKDPFFSFAAFFPLFRVLTTN